MLRAKNTKTNCQSPSWLNPAIQILTMACALLVNFLVPLTYGVLAFGYFIQANILVFLIHKFADIISEPLISSIESKYLFATGLLTSIFVLIIAQWINYFDPIGSQVLLAVMLLSSNCITVMFALKLQRQLLLHLTLVLGVFFIFWGCDRSGLLVFTLSELLVWTNLVPSSISTVLLFRKGSQIPSLSKLGATIIMVLNLFPRNISTTLVFNCLTNVVAYILAKELSARDIGMFRIITSILQSATTLFPISAKAIFVGLIDRKNRIEKIYALITAAFLYFSVLGICALFATFLMPKLAPYMEMIVLLPIVYWAVLLERYMLAAGMFKQLIMINLLVGGSIAISVFFVKSLKDAELLYALGLSAYACALLFTSQLHKARYTICAVIMCSLLVLYVEAFLPGVTLAYMCLLVLASFVFIRFRLSDLISLKI